MIWDPTRIQAGPPPGDPPMEPEGDMGAAPGSAPPGEPPMEPEGDMGPPPGEIIWTRR